MGMLVFLIVLALALPYFLNVDRYRDTIASAIEAQTGRHVTLGKIRAKFLPGVGFVVEDLHIGSPPGFPAGDVVSADAIRGNVAISPLMHSTVYLNSLELVHPKLTLVSDNNGKNQLHVYFHNCRNESAVECADWCERRRGVLRHVAR
jgi:AsmA protein